MILKVLTEVIWSFFQQGRARATTETLGKEDISQYVQMGVGNKMRARYYEGKKLEGENDYYFYSGALSTKEYELQATAGRKYRRVEIPEDIIKLPHNMDITNVYPVSGSGCECGDITQVSPGEENFYLGPEYSDFKFYVEKGRGLNLYHIPDCIKQIVVERLFVNDNMDISLDMAYDIANEILLGVIFKDSMMNIKPLDNNYSPKPVELRRRLEEAQTPV